MGVVGRVQMEETLKEILRTLQDYGTILRHIDGRIDMLEGTIDIIRQNQISIAKRETAMEENCRERHEKVDQILSSLSRRISAVEARLTPIPYSVSEEG